LARQKKVHKEGVYKKVNSAPKTVAKNKIKSKLTKWKRFTLSNVVNATMQGETIQLEQL